MSAVRRADALQGPESARQSRVGWGRWPSSEAITTVLAARAGFFPLNEQLEWWDEGWSEGIARQAVWLSGLVPFEQAEAILQEIGQVNISRSSIWRRSQVWGAKFKALEEAERAQSQCLAGEVAAAQP